MKRILITGAGSYIGTSFEKWMLQFGDEYQIDTLDMHGDEWKKSDFSVYDSVFHVAGIAHADVSKISDETKQLYYKINCDLAVETAEKYKCDLGSRTGQFIYMSSIIIYGEETNIYKKRMITPETKPNPSNFYGDSKLKAEQKLLPLKTNTFFISILRPPMIYGEGSKGNYQLLVNIAKITPVFPNIRNERSMLHIDNLCKFIKALIDNSENGIFFPQDKEYIRTSNLISEIAEKNGRKIYLLKSMNWIVYLLGYFPGKIGKIVNKAFGNLTYVKDK